MGLGGVSSPAPCPCLQWEGGNERYQHHFGGDAVAHGYPACPDAG